MTNLIQFIENQGGILSSELAKFIVSKEKIGEEAARKRIQRLTTPIHKLKGLFSENQSFLYHSSKYNSQAYFEALQNAFEQAAKRCYSFIVALDYHHGILQRVDFPNYTFSPTSKIKGHIMFSTLVERLIKIGVLYEYDDEHLALNTYLSGDPEPNFRHSKAIHFSKNLVLSQFSNWSRNIGLTSFNTGQFNKEIGGFQFGFGSPSYINGLVQYNESVPKPGFVVADVLIGNSTTSKEVDFFIQKITAIRSSNPTIRLFPVLILDGVEVTALNKLKKVGVLIATIREIFGESYNELLKNLINTITNAGAILKKDPESYIKLMDQLTKLVDGKTNNLRGDLFELAVAYYYGKQCQSLDVGKRIRLEDDPKIREIDVLANYESEVRAIECKGYNYPVDEDFIKVYLSEKIPAIRKWLVKTFSGKKHGFEIWSTGGFTPEAITLLEKARKNTSKYSIDFLGRDQILERAKQLQTSKFSDILREYYFKELV